MADWPEFLKVSRDKPLHPIWEHLDPHLRTGQIALELGCGAGTGVVHLLEKGLKVIAVDQEPEALAITKERLPEDADVHLLKAQFQDFGLEPESVDVVVAGFSLFFLRSWEFRQVWRRVVNALRPEGLFAGQLLGPNDDWASRGYTVHNREEAQSLLRSFKLLHFEEVERDGETILRQPKHWHVFHVVARKLP